MKKQYYLILLFLVFSISLQAQYGKQKKADKLYSNFAYTEAVDLYKELIENKYNLKENRLKLADTYMKLRSPENAVFYYEDLLKDSTNISTEVYYEYAQALRGAKRYDESREWLQKYLKSHAGASAEANKMLNQENSEIQTTYRLIKSDFNSEFSDFGALKYKGETYLVSARNSENSEKEYSWNEEPFLDIYKLNSGGEVSPISGEINTKLHDGPISFSPDGETLYFTRNNYFNNKEGKRDKEATNHLKIYSAQKSGNNWVNIQELPFNSDDYSVGHPTVSKDGKTLFFASDMPGGEGGTDLYKIIINKNDTFETPENLGSKINTAEDETFPFIDEDNVLYFSSTGHGGYGLADIFKSDLKAENIEIQNLGETINSNLDDFSFFRETLTNAGFIASNRDGSDNVYGFNQLLPLILKGKVTDVINGNPIAQATIRLFNKNNQEIAFLESDEDGNYQTAVNRNVDIPLEAKQIEYKNFNDTLDTRNMDGSEEMIYDIELQPVADVEYLAEINNIYFDFDKSNIRPDAAEELDKLAEIMKKEYPDLVIEIGSHTDKRGSDNYNEALAERRAEATRDYLIAEGISGERIQKRAFGERKPAIDCDRCSSEQHQLNRRSMFNVVKMN
ncbi:flagellar motor protein MotB [Salegentibacter salinarum]|uniref:Flagellar motor protein MotB n=1 Tax=Salegentibacter salinarum TaxID=447422 RepID=A0A2N0TWY4_9FLAO|nr:OmpA family protein [Salegentibacter salinarum]PKD19239.1 flagellar motor protein MotB [Salegentibacter salinarum]SKB94744.1 WD40-like Beta Propeller Repeat [Salegentibacter salinarum]